MQLKEVNEGFELEHPFEVKDFNDSNPFACEIIRTGKKIS
ncbi:hypothetical protein ES708_00679 [subsurface metagenome]